MGPVGRVNRRYGQLGEGDVGVLQAEVGLKSIQLCVQARIRQEDAVQVQVKVVRCWVE